MRYVLLHQCIIIIFDYELFFYIQNPKTLKGSKVYVGCKSNYHIPHRIMMVKDAISVINVLTLRSVDHGVIPGQAKRYTIKLAVAASLLNMQY